MDEHTRRTREWLDAIFAGPAHRTYIPHSPILGFDPRSDYLGTYCHVFAILTEMARYDFKSCLEVGAGEGFLSDVIRRVFGVPVAAVDLSWSANRRAREALGLMNVVGEARELPFKNGCVDLVVSVNTLEHVLDVGSAFAELARVARGVAIIGMPHAAPWQPKDAVDVNEPHAHVSMLTRSEMHAVFGESARIRGSLSRLVRPLYALAARDDITAKPRYARLKRLPLRAAYQAARWIGSRVDARALIRGLCRLDRAMSSALPAQTYESIIVRELSATPRRIPLSADAILAAMLR